MTTKKQVLPQSRRYSTESSASMWEKFSELPPQPKQDAPFGNDDKSNDSLEDTPTFDYNNDGDDTDTETADFNINQQNKPWEYPTKQEHFKIIINNQPNIDELKQRLKQDLSRQGLKWTNEEEEELRPWHFGLTSIYLKFNQPQNIDIQKLSLSSSVPFWMKFKKEKQQNPLQKNINKKSTRHKFPENLDVSLHYGALTDLNQFYYSPEPQHQLKNMEELMINEEPTCLLFLNDHLNGGGYIEWVAETSKMRRKRQLLVNNINHSVIVDSCPEGFDIYICQKCNMNEFKADANGNDRSDDKDSNRSRNTSRHRNQRPPNVRSNSRPRAPPPLRPQQHYSRQRRNNYGHYHRIGVSAGCYFPTVQFSLRLDQFRLVNNGAQNSQKQIKQTLSLFIEFFLAHKISVCYGKINSDAGPTPHLFFQPTTPPFPSLIMKYSWQMLSTVGYRLQIQIGKGDFLRTLTRLSKEEHNPDELFYRVCVYLSRILSLKPFVNINDELEHAITESKRKRSDSAYGLISKIDVEERNEAYIPSVTLTPTTIRIKPLKLCRTNRVLRARDQFGKALYHFVLVDIRDENNRDLQSFHFRHIRPLLLDYLKEGFVIMDDNRTYQYLHHSKSQLRSKQFWFYHHNNYDKDHRRRNKNFHDAYKWMGDFDEEKNPAKYAVRMALCFSTTKPTVMVPRDKVRLDEDIEIKVNGKVLSFTDGCGTMSEALREEIKEYLGLRRDFSAVQFRYAGVKGVVSVDPHMARDVDLCIRKSMEKFDSEHECFEVCKLSAPRPVFLNRQAILLLSYRKISDVSFLTLQQQSHLTLIRGLLRNSDAEKLILEKVPSWFLPPDVHYAHVDYIHEPFFRQLLISSCLQSTRELLNRTRIRIPKNEGRNMMGIVDEYKVLKQDEVYIQYTIMDRDQHDDNNDHKFNKTKILHNRKVVITKNPCHHPGDVRTFTAVNYPELKHLKDVIVFSQQGNRPAPHDISGSDLDGDEYLVVWHKDLVPDNTDNAEPYDYDSKLPPHTYDKPVTRDDVNDVVLNIAESDYLGRLSNLHLAFADRFGVDDDTGPGNGIMSTIELAGAISLEVDSGKTGYHPLNDDDIKKLNDALKNKRPDFMDNPNYEQIESKRILGQLFRASKRTLPGWNRLVRYHRHLRHLEVRTHDEPEEIDEVLSNNEEETNINQDPSLLNDVDRNHHAYRDIATFTNDLASVYRQEMLEILSLYGLSHESDVWCRNSVNGLNGEVEDTAYTELEQLVDRTRTRFFNEQVSFCETGKCHIDTPVQDLCNTCRKRQQSMAVACYCSCYGGERASHQAPILSLPWLFATPLLQDRISQSPQSSDGLLSIAMQKALNHLVFKKGRLILRSTTLKFQTSKKSLVGEVDVDDATVCVFIEVLQNYLGPKNHLPWLFILDRFVETTQSGLRSQNQPVNRDRWKLKFESHKVGEEDEYATILMSISWTEREDKLMHDYFENILNICFDEGRERDDVDFLNLSEDIILLLQKMAIKETIF